ncbi:MULTISPECIES: DUF1800 family protein [unclassified Janthinobacterium]|uniref:DUF1800 domain-containing protein n=1 Tax=unclassified Janthinobacterium TaxID=2610881 RepID=UPI000882CE94|nr:MULTISPECIES: DUF1800 domain-containing protein [unclassified Janthinobacterium]SDA74898.1 Protein of unknown function [Janthinobacterium sp. 551a]SFB58104.1 Protein of unknown function [Janthinobacterium sp. 344]
MTHPTLRRVLALLLISLLSACGGGGGDSQSGSILKPDTPAVPPTAVAPADPDAPANPPGDTVPPPPLTTPPVGQTVTFTRQQASRFLGRATFGPNMAAIDALAASDSDAWFTAQFSKPQTLHRKYIDGMLAAEASGGEKTRHTQFYESFWQQGIRGEDQLRQRVAFALSEIFVISLQNGELVTRPRGIASFYDMLGQRAFGNFRDLLQDVALHPMMGLYMSHMRNQKETATRTPDENFAREVMQLFTIGLYQLNADGSLKLSGGKPIETYTHDDVAGLARVFTGWSWAGPDQSSTRFYGGTPDPDRDWQAMQNYAAFHSSGEKRFLGKSISGATSGEADLKVALDTLFNHPNAGPFFGRQLIQRLVTSNPSPAYIGRVAAAFANNGSGVRGDMQAVIRAVLLDPDALAATETQLLTGKLREPLLRLAHWMRAFDAQSTNGRFRIYNVDDSLAGLGQSPLNAPSVFNFFRPAYVPPNSGLATSGLVAPELQITSEPSVTGYLNYMQSCIASGAGDYHDIAPDYTRELALAANPGALLDRIDLLLTHGSMPTRLRGQITTAVNGIAIPAATASNATQVATAQANRVKLAIFLTMASPAYLVQK